MRWGWLILVLFILGGNGLAQSTQTPAEFFGYTFGDDPRVPDWERVVAYFEHLDETSLPRADHGVRHRSIVPAPGRFSK